MGRPPKPPEEKLVTLSVRVPRSSLELLDRVVDGEVSYLERRKLPTRGVHRSSAFRAIWELGELEYVLQRVTLWVTRRSNRYTVEQAAHVLGWKPDSLRRLLEERGVAIPPLPTPELQNEPLAKQDPAPRGAALDPKFLV